MKWSDVGNFLKGSLPVLGTALLGPAGGMIGGLVSSMLGADESPDQVMAKLREDPQAILKFKLAELETNKDVLIACQEQTTRQLEIVNATMREETKSEDAFVRRWRPFYGYCVAISWLIQMIGFTFVFGYTSIVNPDKLMLVIQQFAVLSGSLIALWGIALAVLGVSVHKRSLDKQTNLEGSAKGLLSKFLGK